MADLQQGRWTALPLEDDAEVTVFLIGMRINRWWKVRSWFRVSVAMPRMLRYLASEPDAGMLSFQQWLGRTTILVSYWRSQEDLVRFARDPELAHLPAWRAYHTLVGSDGDVGVWHETYRLAPGAHEEVYVNMPAFGLGAAIGTEPVGTGTATAAQRWRRGVPAAAS